MSIFNNLGNFISNQARPAMGSLISSLAPLAGRVAGNTLGGDRGAYYGAHLGAGLGRLANSKLNPNAQNNFLSYAVNSSPMQTSAPSSSVNVSSLFNSTPAAPRSFTPSELMRQKMISTPLTSPNAYPDMLRSAPTGAPPLGSWFSLASQNHARGGYAHGGPTYSARLHEIINLIRR